MTDHDLPDPAFAAHLEWQLRTELRREAHGWRGDLPARSMAIPTPAPRARAHRRMLMAAAVVLASAAFGAAAATAVGDLRAGRDRALLVQRAERVVEIASRRAEWLTAVAQDAETRRSAGLASSTEFDAVRLEARRAAARLERARLELDETRLAGEPPREALWAPLIAGRDFVSERLRLDMAEATESLEWRRGIAARVGHLEAAGAVSEEERAAAALNVDLAKSTAELAVARLDLRQRFVDGTIDAREVERTDVRLVTADRRNRAALEAASAARNLERIELLFARGAVPRTELLAARDASETAAAEVSICDLELRLIDGP